MTEELDDKLNPKLLAAFVYATNNVLKTMVGVEPKVGKPRLKSDPAPSYDVSGIIGFSGDVKGSVVISYKKEAAIRIVEAFCGERMELDSEDFVDAIGELANMIAGNAKKNFNLDANISIPSVVIGTGHSVARLSGVPCIVIPCESEVGDLAVEINIKETKKTNQKKEETGYEVSACR